MRKIGSERERERERGRERQCKKESESESEREREREREREGGTESSTFIMERKTFFSQASSRLSSRHWGLTRPWESKMNR